MKSKLNYTSVLIISIILFTAQSSYSQFTFPQKKKNFYDKKTVEMKKDNSPLSKTPVINYSAEENNIQDQMNQLKRTDNFSLNGDKILGLQKKLESTNGSTVTKQETNPIGKVIIPSGISDNIFSGNIFDGDYVAAIASQVEQRAAGDGKIWVAVGHSNADTGVGAAPDTIALYYSNNGGNSFTEYVRIAFSSANKIGFDDLDMEIIENTSGTKYIYLVFGYYTDGYRGDRLIGYIVVSTPTLAVSGATLSFPGQTASSIYFNARITSDNARYAGVPYVTIIAMQDSTAGSNDYFLTKMCRVLSPYTLTPSFTYFSQSIYSPAPGFIDYGVTTDIAYFNNTSDSLVFLLSGYPGYNDKMYFYKAFGNAAVYPSSNGFLLPTGNNVEYARIAANGGTNQTKLLVTYSDDYNNSGDFDQWYLTTPDANNWSAGVLEYNSFYKSRYGDVIGRRNADGSFSVAFLNSLNYMNNITTCRFSGNFNLDSYLHSTNTSYSNSIANPKPAFRYVDSDSCLNFWSYFYSLNYTAGCSAINFYISATTDGYYNDVTGSVPFYYSYNVILAEQNPPYNHLDTAVFYPDPELLMNEIVFKNAPDGDYYFILKHYNALETWSANPVTISGGTINSYDFTSSDAQAYGNNLKLKGTKWCLISGDVDQDGIIDATDLSQVENEVSISVPGYSVTDLNGDFFTDASDISIVENNIGAIAATP